MEQEFAYILAGLFVFVFAPAFAWCARNSETDQQRQRRYELETLHECHYIVSKNRGY